MSIKITTPYSPDGSQVGRNLKETVPEEFREAGIVKTQDSASSWLNRSDVNILELWSLSEAHNFSRRLRRQIR